MEKDRKRFCCGECSVKTNSFYEWCNHLADEDHQFAMYARFGGKRIKELCRKGDDTFIITRRRFEGEVFNLRRFIEDVGMSIRPEPPRFVYMSTEYDFIMMTIRFISPEDAHRLMTMDHYSYLVFNKTCDMTEQAWKDLFSVRLTYSLPIPQSSKGSIAIQKKNMNDNHAVHGRDDETGQGRNQPGLRMEIGGSSSSISDKLLVPFNLA